MIVYIHQNNSSYDFKMKSSLIFYTRSDQNALIFKYKILAVFIGTGPVDLNMFAGVGWKLHVGNADRRVLLPLLRQGRENSPVARPASQRARARCEKEWGVLEVAAHEQTACR